MSLYRQPPPDTHVLCVDEMGPTAAKTYWAARWSERRPPIEADYGRRGKVWTFGAFEPGSGQALTWCADGRTSANFIAFLDRVVATWTQGAIILILDNLSTHKTLDVLLWALTHPRVRFLFQPTYTPWLNLIEPWWKTLRSLALKGRRFLNTDEIIHAIQHATDYWNRHRRPFVWRKAA
ncbi:MAG: IS630 family transposase [Anaerolineae bacterium]|nr:IS630 family transposase [Anaerolineae bacterium]